MVELQLSRASELGEGGVRIKRMLAVVAPCLALLLVFPVGIYFGWWGISIAAAQPLEIRSSHGSGSWVYVGNSSVGSVADASEVPGVDQGAAVVHVRDSVLDDLCLSPAFGIPFTDKSLRIRISVGGRVDIGEVTLAADRATLAAFQAKNVAVGVVDGRSGVPGGTPVGGFTLQSDREDGLLAFDDLTSSTYGMYVDKGLQPRSLAVSTGGGGC